MNRCFVTSAVAMVLAGLLGAGCSSNMFAKGAGGAAAGAASSALLGAVTDLIVDGSVNTHRLERNLVSGALAGGAAGVAVGAHQDQMARAQQQAATPPKPPPQPERKIIDQVGQDNYEALVDLVHYRHEDAYRKAVDAGRSKKATYRQASYVVRALVDKDRGNADGVEDALYSFMQLNDEVDSEAQAMKGLEDLYRELEEERKVQGVWRKR